MIRYNDLTGRRFSRNTGEVAFKGLDLTSPRLKVDENRAIDECNYIYKDGLIQKRLGTEPIELGNLLTERFYDAGFNKDIDYVAVNNRDFTTLSYGNVKKNDGRRGTPSLNYASSAVHGIWFIGDNIIVHKGKLLYYNKVEGLRTLGLSPLIANESNYVDGDGTNYIYTYEMPDKRCQGFVGNGKLWLLTGTKYIVIDPVAMTLTNVESSKDVYVPTTTVGITPNESGLGYRSTNEAVNLLTSKRKNKLIGGAKKSDGTFKGKVTYVLDGVVDVDRLRELRITIVTSGANE